VSDARASRPLIRVAGVGKTYPNGHEALSGISLTIPSTPQFVSLLGPSGCGKSTLLRMIAGLDRASAGTIEWPTSDYDAAGEPKPSVGFVFQEPTLMPWASVFENVYLPFRIAGRPRRAVRDEIMTALAMVHLADFASAFPRELSGGMKMRVSIARALATRPQVLLMDEPFAALDEITRLKLNDDLLALWQAAKTTVIFVTHSVFESVYLSDRIVIMAARPGRIVSDVRVDAPYPRGEAFRTSAAYNDHCRAISAGLRDATAGTGEAL
jgi:NitT/TauT family transport system ATP-binding protein